jgi:hypothetical protein
MAAVAWLAAAAQAHMVSISTGDLRVEGRNGKLELLIPAYEAEEHLKDPQREVIGALRFSAGDTDALVSEGRCFPDPAAGALRCELTLEFASEPAAVTVESRLHEVLVRNHVLILRASSGDGAGRAVLDVAVPRGVIRFQPPTFLERAGGGFFTGVRRVWSALAQLLFLFALAIAARSVRELAVLALAYMVGQGVACWAVALLDWRPAPAFIEAAAALTIAYLALETLLFPAANYRWLVVGVLGAVLGLGLGSFLTVSEVQEEFFFAGAVLSQLTVLALMYWLRARLPAGLTALRPERYAAGLLVGVGLGWFVYRLL